MSNQWRSIVGWIKRVNKIFQSAVFSPRCRICSNLLVFPDEEIVCRGCRDKVSMINAPLCRRCGRVVGSNRMICGDCVLHPPIFRRHLSYSFYDGVLKDLILLFKYGEICSLKKLLAGYYIEMLAEKVDEELDLIVPVPPDKSRRREFSPVRELAEVLSRNQGIKLLTNQLIKVRATAPQAGLTREKRIKNLNRAFELRNPGLVKGKKVLLIDDVYTTGTTIKKCSQLLVRAKADVLALTLARSV